MPELPEVETIVRTLRGGDKSLSLVGRRIVKVSLHFPRHIAQPSVPTFRGRIRNRVIKAISRRGKYIVFSLDEFTMLIHLRMSGGLALHTSETPRQRHEHTVFYLDGDWQLRFRDVRKFGRIHLLEDPNDILGSLGPEPLSEAFTMECLAKRLTRYRRMIKPLLLDQSFLAGLGNIYTDEALHRAKIHPRARSHTLDAEEIGSLWRGIRDALEDGLRHNGASIDRVYPGGDFQNHFRVYHRTDEPCLACHTPIQRIKLAQRSTHFCPSCQKEKSL